MKLSAFPLFALLASRPVLAQRPDSAGTAVAVAEVAARSWLTLIDQRRYGESWDSAAAIFRSAVSKAKWDQAVQQSRGPFEPFGGRTLQSATYTTSLPHAPSGQYVVLQYETQAAGKRSVIETVTPMKESNGTCKVSGYYIRPQ
jgi:hypothetical protein